MTSIEDNSTDPVISESPPIQEGMSSGAGEQDLPAVHVRRQRRPSPVWLIPLAALLVGFWLLYQYWQQRGEVITVRFPSAESIVAGSTEVRYKAVSVGKVKQVILDEELNPLVTLSLSKNISPILDCSAQFWVVKPRIKGAEISGISTLFSGTYIGMIPKRPEDQFEDSNDSLFCYEGLEGAPVIKPDRPGREFKLLTDTMGSLDIGSPVLYRQLDVGEVIEYKLSAESGKIELGVFIDQPYYQYIHKNTRFWNASGAEFKVDSTGAEFRMESLTSLVIGGIAFDSPQEGNESFPTSEELSVFELYPDFDSSREKRYNHRLYYTLYFNGSLRGLAEEAPVEFQGIRIGKVEKIKMHLDKKNLDVRIPVLISIEPERFSEGIAEKETRGLMEAMVAKGMRATLQSGNLLTGQRYVALAFDEKAAPSQIKYGQFHSVFPTSPTPVEELSKLAVGVAEDVKTTLSSISRFMESRQLDKTVEGINRVLEETEVTVQAAREAMEDVSQLLGKIESETLPTLTADASKVLRQLNQKTLPTLTNDASKVLRQLDQKTLPTLTNDAAKVLRQLDQTTLPAISNNANRLSNDVSQVMDRVDKQTLPTLARSMNQLSKDSSQVLQQVNKETLPAIRSSSGTFNRTATDFSRSSHELNKTMQRLQGTLSHLDRMLAQNSPTQHQLMEMMEEVTTMARSVRLLTEQLERQPESVLRGKRELK